MWRNGSRRQAREIQEVDEAPRGGGARQLIALLTVAFVVMLGVVVATRMSNDAIAVLVGVIAGVAASIPCALLLMVVTDRRRAETQEMDPALDRYGRRRNRGYEVRPGGYGQSPVPPVIVVTPGSASPQQLAPWAMGAGAAEGGFPYPYGGVQAQPRREFRVMGYEEADGGGDWEG